jgi:hypothetical protein
MRCQTNRAAGLPPYRVEGQVWLCYTRLLAYSAPRGRNFPVQHANAFLSLCKTIGFQRCSHFEQIRSEIMAGV